MAAGAREVRGGTGAGEDDEDDQLRHGRLLRGWCLVPREQAVRNGSARWLGRIGARVAHMWAIPPPRLPREERAMHHETGSRPAARMNARTKRRTNIVVLAT